MDDKRLIEDYLPIDSISADARQENSVTQARGFVTKALLSVIHRWWARRPLSACRAAVYGALVPPASVPGQINFVEALCKWRAPEDAFVSARASILAANGGRLPRVLDMFGGGGSIPLEACRLGCETYSIELNPVAYIVQLSTLVYPAKFGRELAEDVKHWSRLILDRVRNSLSGLYPNIQLQAEHIGSRKLAFANQDLGSGFTPVAYFWTRNVPCKNPGCRATIPLLRQSWMRKKPGAYVALRPTLDAKQKRVAFEVLHSGSTDAEDAVREWSFDPENLSSAGETACPFCRGLVDGDYIKACGSEGKLGSELIAVAANSPDKRGKTYFAASASGGPPDDVYLHSQIERLLADNQMSPLNERFEANPRSMDVQRYGVTRWEQLFSRRQMLVLLSFASEIRSGHKEMIDKGVSEERARAVTTYLALALDRLAERNWTITHWDVRGEFIQVDIGSGRLPMNWDFPEANPLADASGSWEQATSDLTSALESLIACNRNPATVQRCSSLQLPFDSEFFDAIVTDPPYYDNVSYSNLSDFFYIWLKRTVGHLYPEHFALELTPKKQEIIAAAYRHGGDSDASRKNYEQMMAEMFSEAHRVLKPDGPMVCVYAHKTTAGWTTLINALRASKFIVTEAWPLDTENPSRQTSKAKAALASSIFIVARRRDRDDVGTYEEVQPQLETVVQERVKRLWTLGISGADLVIACVGAGLSTFTRYCRVEYANGEEVPAERFLSEVETVVLETILGQLSTEVSGSKDRYGLASVDAPTRFYILWRYTYKTADLDAGEAIIFSNGTHVELDGLHGVSSGSRPLVEKKKSKYRLLDYLERGDDAQLGMPTQDGLAAPVIDSLQRLLWLMERHPSAIPDFLRATRLNSDQLRLVAQALAGPALKGGELGGVATGGELSALTKLTANWRSVVEDVDVTPSERRATRVGQSQIDFPKGGRQ